MGQACGCGCKDDAVTTAEVTGPALALEETVATAGKRSPHALAVLRELGIDTCCGGSLTLAQAAVAAGISADRLLRMLGDRAER